MKNVLIEDSDGTDEDINETYLYNGQGQRIIKTFVQDTTTSVTKYLYSGSAVIMTADSASIKITENILTPSGQIISSQRFDVNGNGTGWYSYNYDIRSSTTAIVNSSGVVQNSYEYDAFGDTVESGSLLNEVAFTGAISDGTTGLYYMNARYYNSDTGRFISQDSYKGSMYEPWTQNLYSYVGNNPVNMVDPTGHWPLKVARMMLKYALKGNGEKQFYGQNSIVSKALRNSVVMEKLINDSIQDMNTLGVNSNTYEGSVSLYDKSNSDDRDLSYSVGKANYKLTIESEKKTKGILWWKKEVTVYKVEVVIEDRYDFDEYRQDKSIGSILNNWGYNRQKKGKLTPFQWEASYKLKLERD